MASYTTNLNLLKKNPLTEGSDTFNITTMLNDNWDKIDAKIGNPAELWVWEKKIPASSSLGTAMNYIVLGGFDNTGANNNWDYSSEISIDKAGKVSLVNPTTVQAKYSNSEAVASIIGKYIKLNSGTAGYYDTRVSASTVYYVPPTATVSTGAGSTHPEGGVNRSYCVFISQAQPVTGTGATHIEYLTSPTSTTYPEDGQSGDYWYTRLGQIGGCAHIETGSYLGTGTYGSSNPNSLTFGFVPKIVIVGGCDITGGARYRLIMIYGSPYASAQTGNSSGDTYLSWSDKTVSWYNNNAASYQMNILNTYYYTAIG